MKIEIVLEVPDEFVDEDHESGMTNEGHEALNADLMSWSIAGGPDRVDS